jgi:hypothetical protein
MNRLTAFSHPVWGLSVDATGASSFMLHYDFSNVGRLNIEGGPGVWEDNVISHACWAKSSRRLVCWFRKPNAPQASHPGIVWLFCTMIPT